MIFHHFLIDFDSFLRGVPTPGSPGAPQGSQRGLQVFFSLIFRGPRGGLGAPFGPWGAPRAPKWRPSRAKKWEKDRSRRPSRSQADFGGDQGGARTLRMWLNHNKYWCFRKGPLSRIFSQKTSQQAPKSELLASLLAPGAVFEPTSAPRGRSGEASEPLCEKHRILWFSGSWPGGAET